VTTESTREPVVFELFSFFVSAHSILGSAPSPTERKGILWKPLVHGAHPHGPGWDHLQIQTSFSMALLARWPSIPESMEAHVSVSVEIEHNSHGG
jgi:hypothetical protein